MKISNSKKQLASIISENGGWRDEAEWAAMDKTDGVCNSNSIGFFSGKYRPECYGTIRMWRCRHIETVFMGYEKSIFCEKIIGNWHQSCLSRAEYFHLYPAPDADGWIEWEGGECPVDELTLIDVKYRDGVLRKRVVSSEYGVTKSYWRCDMADRDIIAYRLHKQDAVKPTDFGAVGDDEANLADKKELEAMEYCPSIEQLMQIHCDRAHALGEKKAELLVAERQESEALDALKAACREAGFDISPVDNPHERQKPELVITDWRDLRVGDEVRCLDGGWITHFAGRTGAVVEVEDPSYVGPMSLLVDIGGSLGWGGNFEFIRRP